MKYDFDEIIDREHSNSMKYSGGRESNEYLPEKYIPMWVADMDFACPPPVIDAMKRRLDRRILGYSMPYEQSYYDAVCSWLERRHALKAERGNIVYSSGIVTAMGVAVTRLTSPGDSVLIMSPSYKPFYNSCIENGRTPLFSRLKENDGYYTVDFEDFEAKAKRRDVTLCFLCSPHNPTGRVWSRAELSEIGRICFENNVFVFSDEIHCDLTRTGVKHILFASLFPDEKRIITATAPSKTFNLAGNQLSNLVIADEKIASDWRDAHRCGLPNPLAIDACVAAYNECEDWLDELRLYLDANMKMIDTYVKEELESARFCVPEGTYLAWLDLRGLKKSDAELKEAISRAGLFIEYSDDFCDNGDGFVRINAACPHSVLKNALDCLKSAFNQS